jgi:threonine synthase
VFAEPAGAASYAGLKKAVELGKVDPAGTVVFLVTGNGLKDVAAVMKVVGQPRVIPPDAEVLRSVYPEG